ncbi:MAG: hypothetical protein IJ772_03360, partial [Bacilli bacterium]|nr:hypothetical protein [Bacilli bacterium]
RNTIKPEEFTRDVKAAREEGKLYKCTSCGGELLSFDETAVTFCSYCGQQTMIESQLIEKNNPDFIIPFQKEKEECIDAYKKYVSKAIFAPSSMKSEMTLQKLRGIYMPYAIYHFGHEGNTTNSGRKYSHRSGDYVYYDLYSIDADVNADYNGISYDLLSKFQDRFSQAIPFDYTKAIPYSTNYIAGFYADSLDMGKDTYVSPAQSIVEKDASSKMFKNKQIRKYGCTNPTVPLQLKESKVGMFPVYFLSMLDKTGKNISYAVINGQTGKVVADLPIDFKKYILGSLILTVPFFFLLNSFFVFTPTVVLIFGIILGAISLFISLSQLKELELRENGIEKQEPNQKENSIIETIIPYVFLLTSIFGLILGITMKTIVGFILFLSFFGASVYSKNAFIKSPKNNQKTTDQKKKTEKNKPMIKYIFKPILGIIMGIGVLVINFVNDIYYYGAALGILALIIWSFYDLVVEHNLLTKNKLPQLEKRGGRENE